MLKPGRFLLPLGPGVGDGLLGRSEDVGLRHLARVLEGLARPLGRPLGGKTEDRNVHIGPYSETTEGHYDASIPAGPGSLKGVTSLFPTDTGSTLRTSSEAKVFLPFVGSKLEQLMLVNLRDLWRGEGEVTADWLEKNA